MANDRKCPQCGKLFDRGCHAAGHGRCCNDIYCINGSICGGSDFMAGGGSGQSNGGTFVGNTFRIGRKAATTIITLGLLAVIASEGYAIYDTAQSSSKSYFAFEWTAEYDNESKKFSLSSPLLVEKPGLLPKDANIAVTISMTCEENEVISQSDQDYSLGEEVDLQFEADVSQPMADCIDAGSDLMINITGTVGLVVFGFEAMETDLPESSFQCNQSEGGGEPTLQGCVAWPKSTSL